MSVKALLYYWLIDPKMGWTTLDASFLNFVLYEKYNLWNNEALPNIIRTVKFCYVHLHGCWKSTFITERITARFVPKQVRMWKYFGAACNQPEDLGDRRVANTMDSVLGDHHIQERQPTAPSAWYAILAKWCSVSYWTGWDPRLKQLYLKSRQVSR